MGEAILGGTFNPVHIGHIRLAVEVAEALGLTRVWFMPCAVPPHKTDSNLLPFDLRVALLRAAVQGIPFLDVETLEGDRPGPSYTYTSLATWRERHPDRETPYFLLGVEDFAMLETWHRGADLPDVAHLLVAPRAGSDRGLFENAIRRLWPGSAITGAPTESVGRGLCTFLPVPRLDVSASFIRNRWLAGRAVDALTPPGVIRLLDAHRAEVARIWRV